MMRASLVEATGHKQLGQGWAMSWVALLIGISELALPWHPCGHFELKLLQG